MSKIAFIVLTDVTTAGAECEKVPVVLGVEATGPVDRERRVGRTYCEVGEELELGRGEDATVALVEDVDEAVLALDVDIAVAVDRRSVDAPLKAVWVGSIIEASHGSVGVAMAGPSLRALELLLWLQGLVDLGDVEGTGRYPGRVADDQAVREGRVRVAVKTRLKR
jgi:hypothetical protein